jgi:hypothetical protein
VPDKDVRDARAQTGRHLHVNNHLPVHKSGALRNVELEMKKRMKPALLFAGKSGTVKGRDVTMAPEESVVIRWDPE